MTAHFIAEAAVTSHRHETQGDLIEIGGEPFFRIVHCDAMPPFLMSLVSSSDLWMFVSSTGALTAGRRDPDNTLFPYYTDDRTHDSVDQTGAKTVLKVTSGGRTALWEPFSPRYEGLYRITRSVAKSVYGNKLIFDEVNHDLGLSFSSGWMSSDRFGFVRRAALRNLAADPVEIELLDGIQNLMPSGLTRRFQLEYSTLADGYKENELHAPTGLGLFRLSSIPADQPRPRESLRATTVWCEGLAPQLHLLSAIQLDRFRCGQPLKEERLTRGRRGAYFVQAKLMLAAKKEKSWSLVADVAQDASDVAATVSLLTSGRDLRAEIDRDIAGGTQALVGIVARADGLQKTADERNMYRHFSNTLFNTMRGGIPDQGYSISCSDFKAFLAKANRAVAQKHATLLDGLPETFDRDALMALLHAQRDANLERLAYEYLPLTFSRRHGDPSRPWNIFSIDVKGENGEKILNYQGNWRDIFQNWEALAHSYPGYIESMIFKFLDASTADGYNPYRIMRDGFEWEVLDPNDAWSHIGYWGDHQVVYLPKLLEVAERYHPDALRNLLTRRLFTYANIPYRIKAYEDILKDPHATIDFDKGVDREIRQRAAVMGADGKALLAADGTPYHVNLTEKLLVLILARLFNYIPEAGLWMNTQRPEWNDANNALVGCGVSVVTLCYLRRLLALARRLFASAEVPTIEVSTQVAEAFKRVDKTLTEHSALLAGKISDENCRRILDCLGTAGSDYRRHLYANGLSGQTLLRSADLVVFCDTAMRHIDHSIRANQRSDGLYHSYNLMQIGSNSVAIRRLQEMLEGQVAVLSSGALAPPEAADLLDALRQSKLYRADQNSYLLYPDRTLPGFFEKNNIAATSLARSRTLTEMVACGDRRIVSRDVNGVSHFNAAFYNVTVLDQALAPLALSEDEHACILALYEEVFDHKSFTGRSGAFYKYEGLGCIYWHMVSKLRLAVQEVMWQAGHEDSTALDRLSRQYREISDGIGTHKSPSVYGAIPLDPYSHTPGFAGVQQPGMTGQVKEDIISRFGEMGAEVRNGQLAFSAKMVSREEFLNRHERFQIFDVGGKVQWLNLEPGTLAITICQVPVVLHASGPQGIEISGADGRRNRTEGLCLDVEMSAAIFKRLGTVQRLDVHFGTANGVTP